MKLKQKLLSKAWVLAALFSISLFAFYVRSSSLFASYVNADDPYLAYRMAQYFLAHYSLPANDTLRLYPYGWNYYKTHDHLLWYYISGVFAVLFAMLGFANPASFAVHFFPPFFALLITFVVFLISYELFKDVRIALITSLIFATLPAILYRTNSSFADKEPIASFFMVLSYYFYFKALHSKKIKSLANSILAGLFLAFMAMTWGGAELVITSYILFAFLALLLGKMDKELIVKHILASAVAYSLVYFGPAGYFSWFGINNLLNYAIILSSLIYLALLKLNLTRKIGKGIFKSNPLLLIFIVVLIFFAGIAFLHPKLSSMAYGMLARLREPLAKAGVVASTVAENRPSSYAELASQTGPALALRTLSLPVQLASITNYFLFSVLGFLIIFYEFFEGRMKRVDYLLLISWFIVFVWAGVGAVRLVYLSGYIIALLSAFCLVRFYDLFASKANKPPFKIAVLSILLFILFINSYSGYVFGMSIAPGMSKNWEDALLWIKNHSNKTDVILSWWDYGYIIQFYAQRPTYVDPGHPSYKFGKDTTIVDAKGRDQQVAKFFTSTNETKYLDWLKSLNVRYIVHDMSMIGKYSAVSTIASNGKYFDIIQLFGYTGSACLEQQNNTCIKQVNKYGPIWIILTNTSLQPVYIMQNMPQNISKVCTTYGVFELDPKGLPGCVFIYRNAIAYAGIRCYSNAGCQPYDLSNSLFVQMWFMDANTLQHFKKVYDNGEVKVFEVIY